MKKITLLSVLALALAFTSCDFETQAFKDMRYQRDSIQHLQQTQLDELLGYMDIVQNVDSSFEAIRESQNMLSMVSYDESGNQSVKQRIEENIYMINNLLAENNNKIAELEERLNEIETNHKKDIDIYKFMQFKNNSKLLSFRICMKSVKLIKATAALKSKKRDWHFRNLAGDRRC